ncbi:MAG: hypothetical protein QJR03_15675, partial [Sphaerobacter sp.]|nr:hypothetical protein [Sphaerobacter sp.]
MYGPGPAPQRGVPGPTVAAIAVIALMFGCAAGCIVGVSAAGSPQRPRAAVVPPVAGPTET